MNTLVRQSVSIAGILLCFGCATADSGPDCTSTEGTEAPDYNFADLEWLRDKASKATKFAYNPFEKELAGSAFKGLTCALLVKQIGEPLRIERSELPDRSGTYTDPLIIMHFRGYSLRIINYGRGYPDSMINHIEIIDNAESLKYGLEIGKSTERDVRSAFSDSALYRYDTGTRNALSMSAPAIERDDRYDPAETYFNVTLEFDEDGNLEKVLIE